MHVAILNGKLAHRTQAQHTWKDYSQLTMAKMLYVFIVSFMKFLFKDKYVYVIRRLLICKNDGKDLKFLKKRKQEILRTDIRRFLKLLHTTINSSWHPPPSHLHPFKTFNMAHVVLSIPQDPVHLPGLNANKYLSYCNHCLDV